MDYFDWLADLGIPASRLKEENRNRLGNPPRDRHLPFFEETSSTEGSRQKPKISLGKLHLYLSYSPTRRKFHIYVEGMRANWGGKNVGHMANHVRDYARKRNTGGYEVSIAKQGDFPGESYGPARKDQIYTLRKALLKVDRSKKRWDEKSR